MIPAFLLNAGVQIPPVFVVDKLNANASHNFFFTKIKRGIDRPAAVLAQEQREREVAWTKDLVIFAVVLGAAYLLGASAIGFALLALGTFAVSQFANVIGPFARFIEAQGKATEVEAAVSWYGRSRVNVLQAEAASLTGYKQFDGWTLEEIQELVQSKLPAARKWVAARNKWGARWKAKLAK